ncbi:hypothetical protein L1049_024014 [Liquidambar formosana]|uniref:Uncharacterized protein n=1 Tax=Liquidambar formosana TaxID=63359 RepID=A0AAP0RU75_LIQFO
MVPVITMSGSVQFVAKEEVFIPNDLQLKKSFTEATGEPLFVWFPQNGLASLSTTKLHEIYKSLGVRKISEFVQLSYDLSDCKLEKMDLKNDLIGKALIKILLGFLAFMPVEERHKTAKFLLEPSVLGTEKPIAVSYGLQLPSRKKRLNVEIIRMVLWEKNSQRLLVHKRSWKDGQKNMEFVANFSRAISEAILPNNSDLVDNLCKIIQMGFALGLKNMQWTTCW